jgi:sigma-B regulation protein RsbU (phosphoserine phosphatase)
MSAERAPTFYRYQEALAPLAGRIAEPGLRKRLSEVLTLLDFNSTLNQSLELSEILDLVLFVSMGETRSSWAGILLRDPSDRLVPAARRGRSDAAWSSLSLPLRGDSPEAWEREVTETTKAALVAPLSKSGRLVGALLLGERSDPYQAEEREFAEALSVSAAASIDNGRIYEELRDLNRRLSLKVYQLHSLFDITRELNRSPDAHRVRDVLLTNAMGHILTTRAVLVQDGAVVAERGLRLAAEDRATLERLMRKAAPLGEDRSVSELSDPEARDFLVRVGIEIMVPLLSGDAFHGALLLGPRASGAPLSGEDREFLRSLASQVAAVLDNLRLTREWIEKQKIEKEMALAREIQRGLLPDDEPRIQGWDIAGINIPCLTVGGDYFDYLDRGSGMHWLVIADVSGKGTGAALLMASAQAAVHALAGLGAISLEDLAERLNEIVYQSTEVNRYVTAFFSCLDESTGDLEFVNAGHCYPILMRGGGRIERLVEGSPVIGLLKDLSVHAGRTRLERGDLLVMYTDGLSETRSPQGEEFQEERVLELLRESRGRPSREIVAKLVAGVRVFAAEAGLSDDLTLMVVQRP